MAKKDNSKPPRKGSLDRKMLITPKTIKKDLLSWIDAFFYLNEVKDDYTKDELALFYYNYNKSFVEHRKKYHLLILSNDLLYKTVKKACKDDFLFDVLIDGWSYDTNKTEAGQDPVLAFLPFPHQLPLIETLGKTKKHVHVEKSRRQGISKIMALFMLWHLKHHSNITMLTTHIDRKSLDQKHGDTGHNSVFDYARWSLDLSIFIPNTWREGSADDSLYYSIENKIQIGSCSLVGEILGKSTGTGGAYNMYFGDEMEVVCDKYPNLADSILQGIASASDQMFLYTTYRSDKFPFYEIKERNDTKRWDFFSLNWKDNPTCNSDWYEDAKSKLKYDEVLIARELDMNPHKSRRGAIWKTINKKLHFIDTSFLEPLMKETNNTRYQKFIGADFGGGSSHTALIFALYDTYTATLYLMDYLKTTDMEAEEIVDFMHSVGYKGVDIEGDMSNKAQATSPMRSWHNMFKEQGCHINSISNRNMFETQANIRMAFKSNKILISNKKLELFNNLQRASYKNDKIAKDEYSHLSDALQFLYKSIFSESTVHLL